MHRSLPDVAVASGEMQISRGGGEVTVRWAACTDRGLVRETNQDCYRISNGVAAVCDGLGGHHAGERASAIVADTLSAIADSGPPSVAEIVDAVSQANSAVLLAAATEQGHDGMGTTVVGLALADNGGRATWVGFNVGDSRLYRYGPGGVSQISRDHSVVQELLDEGSIFPEHVRSHKDRHVVTRVMGTEPGPTPDIWLMDPTPDDRFLLCSDGVHGELEPEELAAILAEYDPVRVISGLAAAALGHGARDNFTAVVLDTADVVRPRLDRLDTTVPRDALPHAFDTTGAGS